MTLLIEVRLDEILDLVEMCGFKANVHREIDGNGIAVEIYGFQNTGDFFIVEGIVTGETTE